MKNTHSKQDKRIETLVDDIYTLVHEGGEISEEDIDAFKTGLAEIVTTRLSKGRESGNYLRLSNLGEHCDRKTWYEINRPELGEELAPEVRLKFLIGDVWEAVLLFLARAAGHRVEGEQDEINLHGVVGHRDAVIDGVVVDVKSAAPRSYDRFVSGLDRDGDSFGYLTQLGAYLVGSESDGHDIDGSRAAFLVGDKVLGKITLDIQDRKVLEQDFKALVDHKRRTLSSEKLPPRGYGDEPDGKSGNRKLGTACSYCRFKHACWPGLRTFIYSSGPRFLTTVKREPDVREAKA